MKYQVVGKNIEVTEAMRNVIEDKLKVLEKFFIVGEDVECRVLVRTYKVGQKIEVTIPAKVTVLRAEVINENIYNGVDEAVEKLESQLRKAKTKMNRKNKEHLGTVLALDEIAEENPQYLVGKINVDESPEIAIEFGVSTIPNLVVLDGGKVVNQIAGARPKPAILKMLEE